MHNVVLEPHISNTITRRRIDGPAYTLHKPRFLNGEAEICSLSQASMEDTDKNTVKVGNRSRISSLSDS